MGADHVLSSLRLSVEELSVYVVVMQSPSAASTESTQ